MTAAESTLLTLADWQRAYRDGASPRALLTARLARLHAESPPAAWIMRVDAAALDARLHTLEALDAAFASRAELLRAHPLYGVPFAVKDNIDAAGLPTTAACPAFAYLPETDATVVARVLAAGAVLVGKTNLDQFATGLVGTRSPYGTPQSAVAPGRVSGGSSSGSAVVVARGDVPFAFGTDTAGSGRVPAAFNQIVGLKPTPGRVGTAGVLPACRSLDCVSVFALTVDDAAAVLALVEGPDAADDYSAYAPGRARFGAQPRVGVPAAPVLEPGLGYEQAWEAALARLATEFGATLVPLDFTPLHQTANLLYEGPWVGERYAVVQTLLERQPQNFDPTVRKIIERARRYTAADTFRAHYELRHRQRVAATLWNDVDLLMVPSAPNHPRVAEVDADPIGANARLGTYTNFVNLLGWCALALPATTTAAGLPFGITLIAPAGADAALARLGRRWQAGAGLGLGATAATAPPPAPLPACWPDSAPALPVAVVGAHLEGLPLHHELAERGATLCRTTTTAPHYRLHALPGTTPPKPGMVRVGAGGTAIAVEVWELPLASVGSFVAGIGPPLALGSVELADGSVVHGFLCEAHATAGALDISAFGGWRAWLASRTHSKTQE